MSGNFFLDSNVFVYLLDGAAPIKRQQADDLVREALETGSGRISYQVVQETVNVITRKLNATREQADRLLEDVMVPMWRVNPTRALIRQGLDLQGRYRFGFYDCLIIAAALESGCNRLYSEDLQHDQHIQDLVIENPFRT